MLLAWSVRLRLSDRFGVFFDTGLPVSALGLLQFAYCLLCCYVVSSISSPFRRLRQADHIAEGKARPQHQELHALLFSTSVWDQE